jgi:hypothetical protein
LVASSSIRALFRSQQQDLLCSLSASKLLLYLSRDPAERLWSSSKVFFQELDELDLFCKPNAPRNKVCKYQSIPQLKY